MYCFAQHTLRRIASLDMMRRQACDPVVGQSVISHLSTSLFIREQNETDDAMRRATQRNFVTSKSLKLVQHKFTLDGIATHEQATDTKRAS